MNYRLKIVLFISILVTWLFIGNPIVNFKTSVLVLTIALICIEAFSVVKSILQISDLEERRVMGRYYFSLYSAILLNPFISCQVMGMYLGQKIALWRVGGRIPEPREYKQVNTYHLPFEGRWIVFRGGIKEKTSHSWNIVNQRYAYDFIKIDKQGGTYLGDSNNLEAYHTFGARIVSPANGQVVAISDGIEDSKILEGKNGYINIWCKDIRGNHIILKHDEKEYSFFGHLKKGSIIVKPGDFVKRGQALALCGNSGHSTQPHLHFHLQDHKNFFLSVGIPIQWSNYEYSENSHSILVEKGYLSKNQTVVQK